MVGGAPLWGLQQIPCRDPEQRVGEVATAIPDPDGLVSGGEATCIEGSRQVAVPAFAAVEIVKERLLYDRGTWVGESAAFGNGGCVDFILTQ